MRCFFQVKVLRADRSTRRALPGEGRRYRTSGSVAFREESRDSATGNADRWGRQEKKGRGRNEAGRSLEAIERRPEANEVGPASG